MFPRPRKITRLLFAAILAGGLLLTGILNMGQSTPSGLNLQVGMEQLRNTLRAASEPLPGGRSLGVRGGGRGGGGGGHSTKSGPGGNADELRRLDALLYLSQQGQGRGPSGLSWLPMSDVDAWTFVTNVKYRLDSAGLRAIREMKSAEPRVVVTPPVPAVNPHNFRYIHNPSHVCSSQPSSLTFLVYIHSAPANLKRRQIIRQTWGNPQLLALFNASMVFALGSPGDASVQKMLDMEFEAYGDLLQEDYTDAYRNLTYKGMSALKWAYGYCRQPLFFIKTDDDILLDLVSIVDHILTKTVPARGARRLVLCNLWTTMKVIRDPKSKWGLSKEEFPQDVFPPYCSGSAFILSGDMIPLMYDAALRSKFFWVDDYFVSGALVNKIGVKHERFNSAYLLNGLQVEEKLTNDTKTFMVIHIKNYVLFFKAWHLLTKRHFGMAAFLQKFSTFNTSNLRKKFFKKPPPLLTAAAANNTTTALPTGLRTITSKPSLQSHSNRLPNQTETRPHRQHLEGG